MEIMKFKIVWVSLNSNICSLKFPHLRIFPKKSKTLISQQLSMIPLTQNVYVEVTLLEIDPLLKGVSEFNPKSYLLITELILHNKSSDIFIFCEKISKFYITRWKNHWLTWSSLNFKFFSNIGIRCMDFFKMFLNSFFTRRLGCAFKIWAVKQFHVN